MDDNLQTFRFTWKIENFLFTNDSFLSPTFTIESFHETKWNLELYPKSTVDECIFIYMNRLNDNGPDIININYEFAIITSEGSFALPLKTDNHKMVKNRSTTKKSWKREDLLNDRSFYFPNNSFTVQCQVWLCSSEQSVCNSLTAVTFVGADKFSFKICVQNFSSFYSGQPERVFVPMSDKLEITLKLENRTDDYISIDIRKCDGKSNYFLACKLSLLDIRGNPQDYKEAEHTFGKKDEIWRFPSFIEVKKLKQIEFSTSEDGSLFLDCQLTASAGKVILSRIVEEERNLPVGFPVDKIVQLDTLSNNLKSLYAEKKFSDVVLKAGRETFPAHRAILSCRSPVFEVMFQNDMSEKETGIVDILDIDPSILEELLTFMYSGNIKYLEADRAIKLFSAADKYQVLQLKEICSFFLSRNINLKNACEILQLAHEHSDESLRLAIEEYFYFHSSEILASEAWSCLIDDNTALASEMIRKLSKKYVDN